MQTVRLPIAEAKRTQSEQERRRSSVWVSAREWVCTERLPLPPQNVRMSPAPPHYGPFAGAESLRGRHRRELLEGMPGRHKAERMTRRIGEGTRKVGRWLMAELRGAEVQHGPLRRIEVVDPKVQVNLHRQAGSGHVGGSWLGAR